MAGGMGIPRRGIPLRDRPVVTGRTPAEAVVDPAQPGRQRHCFVTLEDGGSAQALILQWAQEPTGWVALTIRVQPGQAGDVAIQEWIPATRLTAAG